MWDALNRPLRAAAITAFGAGLVWLLLDPPSFAGLGGLLTILAGAALFVLVVAGAVVLMIGREMPEPEFRKLVDRSEALDGLPEEFQQVLERTPVVVSSRGAEHRAYGHYMGGTVAHDDYPHRIVIYEDTLERDFGHDPELLRAQVQRTVRHEVAHHLGWGEPGVRGLGL